MKRLDDTINTFLHTLTEDARNAFIGRYYYFDSLKKVADEPLFTLNFGPTIHYTFYPDCYIYAHYSGTVRSNFFPEKIYTQYQAPFELPQEMLSYILGHGEEPSEDTAPYLSVEECLKRLKPMVDVPSIESFQVISQELTTWAQYAEEYGDDGYFFGDTSLQVWVTKIKYPDSDNGDVTSLVVFDAQSGVPLEVRPLED